MLSVLPVAGLYGQGARIADEGSFTISVNGRTAGRENFRITSTTRGEATGYLVRSDVTYGDRRLNTELTTDATGAAIEYRATVRVSGATEKWEGAVARGRLNATLTSARGTAAREYVVTGGAVVVDADIIHHHWLLGVRTKDGRVPVLIPRRDNAQETWTVSTVGDESLQIGTRDVPATHLRITGGEMREIWIDRSGRLLKVTIPSRNLVAVRDDPPA
jgi:hypothetical protein